VLIHVQQKLTKSQLLFQDNVEIYVIPAVSRVQNVQDQIQINVQNVLDLIIYKEAIVKQHVIKDSINMLMVHWAIYVHNVIIVVITVMEVLQINVQHVLELFIKDPIILVN